MLSKYEKQNTSSSKQQSKYINTLSSSSSLNQENNNENEINLNRVNKNNLNLTDQQRLSIQDLQQRKSIREQNNKKEEMVLQLKTECLRKCNQFLSIIMSDFTQKWNSFEEIDIFKKNENTIIFNRLQEKIDQQTTQYLVICEVNLWESEIKFKTAKDLVQCYENVIDEILMLRQIAS